MFLENVGVGDVVCVECYTSFGTSSEKTITAIKTKYDQITGVAYNIICCKDHHFDARDGAAMTTPSMYYISAIKPE